MLSHSVCAGKLSFIWNYLSIAPSTTGVKAGGGSDTYRSQVLAKSLADQQN